MRTAVGGRCPVCGGTSFVGKRTAKGMVAGGLIFAPQRLKCVKCGTTLKSGSIVTPARARKSQEPQGPMTRFQKIALVVIIAAIILFIAAIDVYRHYHPLPPSSSSTPALTS